MESPQIDGFEWESVLDSNPEGRLRLRCRECNAAVIELFCSPIPTTAVFVARCTLCGSRADLGELHARRRLRKDR